MRVGLCVFVRLQIKPWNALICAWWSAAQFRAFKLSSQWGFQFQWRITHERIAMKHRAVPIKRPDCMYVCTPMSVRDLRLELMEIATERKRIQWMHSLNSSRWSLRSWSTYQVYAYHTYIHMYRRSGRKNETTGDIMCPLSKNYEQLFNLEKNASKRHLKTHYSI